MVNLLLGFCSGWNCLIIILLVSFRAGRTMSKVPILAAELPHCPKCIVPMVLTRSEPWRSGFELRTFECASCGQIRSLEATVNEAGRAALFAGFVFPVAKPTQGELQSRSEPRFSRAGPKLSACRC
jgi:hypothetical protein